MGCWSWPCKMRWKERIKSNLLPTGDEESSHVEVTPSEFSVSGRAAHTELVEGGLRRQRP